MKWIIVAMSLGLAQTTALFAADTKFGTASWYSQASCLKEGTSGIKADGIILKDDDFCAASWDYHFGKKLLIKNLKNGKEVVVVVKDRGPAKRLYRKGRIIDLSKAAFERLASLKQGVIKVSVCELK